MPLLVRERCINALVDAFNTFQPEKLRDSPKYTNNLEDNFLPGVNLEKFIFEFSEGNGGELKWKMRAIRSSSALVVNNFALWKDELKYLSLCGVNNFRNLRFEAKCPIGFRGRRTSPPNLDVLLENDNTVVAIESKCLECFDSHKADFKSRYDTIKDERAKSPWYAQIAILRKDPKKYQFLDAAQLVKHYLGLSHTYPGKSVKLLYLYWEPVNGMDIDEFQRYHEEIQIFKESVEGDLLQFEALSYLDLWDKWEGLSQPEWLSSHLENLKNRYKVAI